MTVSGKENDTDTAKSTPVSGRLRTCRRKFLRGLLALALILVAALIIDGYLYPYSAAIHASNYNSGANGIWLRYTWYFEQGPNPIQKVEALAAELQEHQIRDAYFHVRSVNSTGQLVYHKPAEAKRLTSALHNKAPGLRCIAWIYAADAANGAGTDLNKPSVRQQMVKEAVWLTTVCGFDGVQWDYETPPDNDTAFLTLLRETRLALPHDKLLGVASPMWLPSPVQKWGWSADYFHKVALCCDQIAVMCYDTGFVHPRSYVWLVRQQPQIICTAVAGTGCHAMFGLPAYGQGLRSHNPRAENLTNGIRGLREGLDLISKTDRSALDGAAPFAHYTMNPESWRRWDALWLNKK